MTIDQLAFLLTPDSLTLALPTGSTVNIGLRMLLCGVTLVSAVGKFLDPSGSRQAMGDFGVPSRWVGLAARGLPIIELLLSAAVLFDITSRLACLGLAGLFLVFTLGLGNLLRQDKAPPCNCFGAVHSEPVSIFTVLRALVLAGLSLLCFNLPMFLITPGPKHTVLTALTFVAVGFGTKRVVQWRIKEGLVKQRERLLVGQRLPAVQVKSGEWVDQLLPPDKLTLLIITAPACPSCQQLKQNLAGWEDAIAEELAVVELRLELEGLDDPPEEGARPHHRVDGDTFERFKSKTTPGGILVDSSGTILEPPVVGPLQIEALVRLTLQA